MPLSPSVVAVSGDLTQRARRSQFRRARAFLDALPFPHIVVPGNHDVPLFNLFARTFDPLGGYRRFITEDLLPTLSDDVLWIAGVDTTRPSQWKSGRIGQATGDRLHRAIQSADGRAIKMLVAHHPFDAPDRGSSASGTLSALTAAGIDVLLTGHLHASYAGHTAHRYNVHGRTAVVVEAGTATSTRLRNESNAFNVIRVAANAIDVEMRAWDGRAFVTRSSQRFSRTDEGWDGG